MGLTAALAGSAILLAGSRLEHLAPSWPLILADYGVTIVLHLGLAFAAVAWFFGSRQLHSHSTPAWPARSRISPTRRYSQYDNLSLLEHH